MRIEHLAIWTHRLEDMKNFYVTYFEAHSNEKYFNPKKQFSSYFLTFSDGARLELMHRADLSKLASRATEGNHAAPVQGLAHFAVSLGNKAKVDALTERLRTDGYQIVGEARTTGDGYYESVVADPDGNLVELTV